MGIRIPTIVHDNVAKRCDGCGEVIEGTPWRLNVLDIVATEIAPSRRWRGAPKGIRTPDLHLERVAS